MDPVAGLRWRKSTRSGSNGGGCVETASQAITESSSRLLQFTPDVWRRFTSQVKGRQA